MLYSHVMLKLRDQITGSNNQIGHIMITMKLCDQFVIITICSNISITCANAGENTPRFIVPTNDDLLYILHTL